MLLTWLVSTALALPPRPGGCEEITLADITRLPSPAVIVLGERHGTQPDLRRATRVAGALSRKAPVTVALEAIDRSQQELVDAYERGEFTAKDLPDRLRWEESWGFAWGPYRKLVSSTSWTVLGAGLPLGPAPDDAPLDIPDDYASFLADMMSEHGEMPAEMQSRFARSMTWRDYGIAQAAIEGWSGDGYLVIVTGRGHVEGGLGVEYQLRHMTDRPVDAFVLASGGPCYDGDRVWR